jgi:hypothetical protein
MNRRALAGLAHREILCPHCWHEFHDDDAWFISKHDELRGDPVLLDPDAHKRFGPHEVSPDRTGVVRDPKGMEMSDRACPRCHLQIPSEILERRPFIFSIGGAPYSGKTYFLTSMLHQIGLQMARQFKFNLSYCDSPDTRAFKQFDSTLFRGPREADTELEKTRLDMNTNRVSLDGMEVLLPKPGMFRITPTQDHPNVAAGKQVPDANFVLYDNAGETFDPEGDQHRQASNQTTRHLSQSNGVIFVYDLLQDAHVRERLAGSADPQVNLTPRDCEQERTLGNLIDQVRAYRGLSSRDRIDVPLAVCVQKFDAWRSLLPTWADIDDTSIVWLEKYGLAALHVEEINRNSLFIRQLLEDVAPRFVQLAESSFSVVRYFPVSALGVTPKAVTRPGEDKPHIMVRRGDINPIRVTDPLLWLFTRWKIVPPAVSKTRQGAPMAILAKNPDRITVQFPDAKTRLTLDWEYEGTSTVDPVSGSPCHVPVVERPRQAATAAAAPTSSSPTTATSAAPKPAARKQGLSLDNPEARKKKGGLWDA